VWRRFDSVPALLSAPARLGVDRVVSLSWRAVRYTCDHVLSYCIKCLRFFSQSPFLRKSSRCCHPPFCARSHRAPARHAGASSGALSVPRWWNSFKNSSSLAPRARQRLTSRPMLFGLGEGASESPLRRSPVAPATLPPPQHLQPSGQCDGSGAAAARPRPSPSSAASSRSSSPELVVHRSRSNSPQQATSPAAARVLSGFGLDAAAERFQQRRASANDADAVAAAAAAAAAKEHEQHQHGHHRMNVAMNMSSILRPGRLSKQRGGGNSPAGAPGSADAEGNDQEVLHRRSSRRGSRLLDALHVTGSHFHPSVLGGGSHANHDGSGRPPACDRMLRRASTYQSLLLQHKQAKKEESGKAGALHAEPSGEVVAINRPRSSRFAQAIPRMLRMPFYFVMLLGALLYSTVALCVSAPPATMPRAPDPRGSTVPSRPLLSLSVLSLCSLCALLCSLSLTPSLPHSLTPSLLPASTSLPPTHSTSLLT
jgi:hypothetical protein